MPLKLFPFPTTMPWKAVLIFSVLYHKADLIADAQREVYAADADNGREKPMSRSRQNEGKSICIPELQIIGGIEDNSKIICLIS